jgi:L-ascorbate metabolism protein UlaG (beta-lactamase superfamily)
VIKPVQHGTALLQDIRQHTGESGFAVWWLGQSGFLIKSSAGCLLLDPYLSDSLTKKYAQSDKPHERMTELAIQPELLDMVDVVTSSHNHTDHLDAETLCPLMRVNQGLQLVVPEANRQFVSQRLGCDPQWPLGLIDGQEVRAGGYTVHGIASAHDEVARDDQGRPLYMGYVIEFGPYRVYHSGDTLWHADLVSQLSGFAIDLALLPINGRLPRRRVAGNLWGQEAAALANDIGARTVVPCHFDMFTFNTETPAAFIEKCQQLGQPYRVLRCGERLDME